MSIQIVDSFKLNLNKPIDSRMVTTGIVSRSSIKYTYEGLRVYDIVDKATYVFIDGLWQKENSVVSSTPVTGGSGGGGSSIPIGTTNRIVKYINSTDVGDSSIIDKSIGTTINVGIGMVPLVGMALDIKGMFRATRFLGKINGNQIDTASIDTSKIIPHNNVVGEFSLKTINGSVVWTSSTGLNTDIVINNETSATGTHYLLFSSTANNTTTGVPIYANDASTTKFIGVKPSTSQILGSGVNSGYPSYAFSGNQTAGLYGNNTEVGLSFNGIALLKLNSTKLSIFDTSLNEVLKTDVGKVIFMTGEFSTTLNVTGLATVGSLKVNSTGTTTFTSLSTSTLTTTGLATFGSLTVNSTGTTTFSTLSLSGTLTVTGLTTIANLVQSSGGTISLQELKLTTLNVVDPLLQENGYDGQTDLVNLTVGTTNQSASTITFSRISGPKSGTLINNTLVMNSDFTNQGLTIQTTNQYALPIRTNSIIGGLANLRAINVTTPNFTIRTIGGVDTTTNTIAYKQGTLVSSKMRLRPTPMAIAGSFFNYTTKTLNNGPLVADPNYLVMTSYTMPPWALPVYQSWPGFEAGDIIFVRWTISAGVYAGQFLFYRGRRYGWRMVGQPVPQGTTDIYGTDEGPTMQWFPGYIDYQKDYQQYAVDYVPSQQPYSGTSPSGGDPWMGGIGGISPGLSPPPSPGLAPPPSAGG